MALVTSTGGGPEDATVACMARVVDTSGTKYVQAGLSSVTAKVFDVSTATETYTATLVIADVIFDTLQTGNGWDVDSTGYNFRSIVPASAFPNGSRKYRIEFKFTDTSSAVGWALFDHLTEKVFTS